MANKAKRGRKHANVVIEPLTSACVEMARDRNVPPERMLPAMTGDAEACLEVATFYWQNPSANVIARDPLDILNQMHNRTCTVVRAYDLSGRPMRDGQSTNIVGVAMCHEYTLPVSEAGSERCAMRRHFEFGSLRVRMNGFNIQANLLSIRVMDMLLRQGDRMSPFACAFEENRPVIERLIARRHFALVPKPMPSREMRTLRDYELEQAGAEPKPIAYLKPTMATLLDCANEVCRLRDAPLLERAGPEYSDFADVSRIEIAFSPLYPEQIFDAARTISKTSPATLQDLGRLLHGDPGYFPDYFLA